MLGKKQAVRDNRVWIKTLENIESIITKNHLERLISRTVESIYGETRGKNAAYGWSGGKDSIVLQAVCNMAGIYECVLAVTSLEYPAFMAWITNHKPKNLEVINTGLDMGYLVKHPELLFPQTSAVAAKWFKSVQHKAQKIYSKKRNLDILLLGRRRIDGNHTGNNGKYTTENVTRYSPLANWSHEEVLAFIHYFKMELPPIYKWENGFICGTHQWPARQWTGSIQNGWREVFNIDKLIVIEAARHIHSAKQFLGGTNHAKRT